MGSKVGCFMSRVLIVRKIVDILNESGPSDNGPELAMEFATVVSLVNRRLDTCKMYVDVGQLGEAIRVAEERPPLLPLCSMLMFDRLPLWQSMCEVKGWQMAEPIKTEVAQELHVAFSSSAALDALTELQRSATQANDLRMAVHCLRRMLKLNSGNKSWLASLSSFESRYLSELKDQFFPAVALSNMATMHRIAEEIELGEWSVEVDAALLTAIADMRKREKNSVPVSIEQALDNDLFQTTTDEEAVEKPAPGLEVTTTRIDDARVPGWTPNPRTLLIVCLLLAGLLVVGIAGLFWYGHRNFKEACEKIVEENRQVLGERGGKEYEAIKEKLAKGEYKSAYPQLSELIQREKAEMVVERRKAAEAESARKLAEEAALEKRKAEEAEAERKRLELEKLRKAEEEAAAQRRLEEEALQKAAAAEAERKNLEAEKIRQAEEEAAAKKRMVEEARLKAAEAERIRQEALERKRIEEAAALRKQREVEDRMQNEGFDGSLFMVVDLSGGAAAARYPVAYYKTAEEVPGGTQDEVYKTTKLLLRSIAPGSFLMGSPKDQLGYDDTQPVTETTVTNAFFMGVFEVTQKQWECVMGKNPSYFEDAAASATRPVEQVSCYDIRENATTNKDDPDANWPRNHYVNGQSFMGRLRMKTGIRSFDLPTEVQWEYACRAGTQTSLNSGKNLSNMYIDPNVAEVGRYYSNGGRGYKRDGTIRIMTAPVGSYKPNAWGLYDMHGNVSEWCLDSYRLTEQTEPQWKGKVNDQYCVLRGGGWDNVAWHCLATSRTSNKPFQRNYNAGFRIVRNK